MSDKIIRYMRENKGDTVKMKGEKKNYIKNCRQKLLFVFITYKQITLK